MFHPFSVFHYNPRSIGQWADVLVPPYDVLTPDEIRRLGQRSPVNFSHLDCPERTEAGYKTAAELLTQWLDAGVLTTTRDPAFLLYELTYQFEGSYHTRLGVIGTMDLSDYSEKNVLPHERTLPGPKVDRLQLLQATQTQLSPIFVMTPDPERLLHSRWLSWIQQGQLLADVKDEQGFRHVLTLVFNPSIFSEIDTLIQTGGSQVMIVDGHHRYETALHYAEQRTKEKGHGPWNRVLTYMSVMEDDDLLCLPTHRLVHSIENFDVKWRKTKENLLANGWTASEMDFTSALAQLRQADGQKQCFFSLLKNGESTVWTRAETTTPDVVALHEQVLHGSLGLTKEDVETLRCLKFLSGWNVDAKSLFADTKVQAAFLLPSCPKSVVFEWARSGKTLPQKSTYFYPKVLSGVALYRCV